MPNSTPILAFSAPAKIEAAAGDGPRRFSIAPAYSGDALRLAGYSLPVVVDLAGMATDGTVVANLDHDPAARVGHVDQIDNTGKQLSLAGPVSVASAAAAEFVNSPEFPWAASIEAQPLAFERVASGESATANGRAFTGPILIARKTSLIGVAILSKGADPNARAMLASKGNFPMTTTTIDLDPVAAERQRIQRIDQLTAGNNWGSHAGRVATLRAQAIEGEISNDTLSGELISILRAARPTGPAIHANGHATDLDRGKLLAAALHLHLGQEKLSEREHGDQITSAARRLGIHSLHDLCRASFQLAGVAVPSDKSEMLKAAFSTMSVSGTLSNVANKSLQVQFAAFPSILPQIAKVLSANDFKTHTGYRPTAAATLEQLGATGEIKHANVTETSYTYSVSTFAKMLSVSRQDIINDDLGAFAEFPAALARGGQNKLQDLFWTLVLANTGSFFGSGNANYISGAGTVLQSSQLDALVTKMLRQTDANGKPIAALPKWLVVPPELKFTADGLYASQTVNSTGTSTATLPNANPFHGLYAPLVSPWLSNSSYSGFSLTGWYLFADPADIAAFGVAYLNGQQSPTVELSPSDFNQLGVQMRCVWDIGVTQIDAKGGAFSKGAA